MNTTATDTQGAITSIRFSDLPALRAHLAGGEFSGITTRKDGTHQAVVLLQEQGDDLTWKKATAWSEELGAELPSRLVAAMLFANVKGKLRPRWHWTNETHVDDDSYAWGCYFSNGYQVTLHESAEGSAVAVRLIPITA